MFITVRDVGDGMGRLGSLLARVPHQARRRAVVKTLLYRALMVLVTILVAWLVVGSVRDAVDIGIVANVVKTGTYYGYERLWGRIDWAMAGTDAS
jgi:uncharacterized membrane protein